MVVAEHTSPDLFSATGIHKNLSIDQLRQHAVYNGEAFVLRRPDGPLVVDTGMFKGRAKDDNYLLGAEGLWFGGGSKSLDPRGFELLLEDVQENMRMGEVYQQDLRVVADPAHSQTVRVFSTSPVGAHFAESLFIRNGATEAEPPHFTIYHAPNFFGADRYRHGIREDSNTAIAINFAGRKLVVSGTRYPGQIKKGVFTMLNYEFAQQGIFPGHCSANMDETGNSALFFGLSGTGKTTLSIEPGRIFIGDDEHGWGPDGVFNFEGGFYPKVINLDPEREELIYQAVHQYGAMLENVVESEEGMVDFRDKSKTENTRAAIPLELIKNRSESGMGGHPTNIIFVTYDAYGVLPPVAKLSVEQAMYHFLSGYTSVVGGTVQGQEGVKPEFSACFGADFLPLHPNVYAELFSEQIRKFGPDVWLVNTGIDGTGQRHDLKTVTRPIVTGIHSGELSEMPMVEDPDFGFLVPEHFRGVNPAKLDPASSWVSESAFRNQREALKAAYNGNFRQFDGYVAQDIRDAGPRLPRAA